MNVRRTRKFVRLHAHNRGICHFNRGFAYTCGIVSCGICIFLFMVSIVLFFMFFSRPCTNNSQCNMENPCSIDTCSNGWCHHAKIDSCCVTDSECGSAKCYTSFCDSFQHVCQTTPKNNGSACNTGNSCTIDETCQNGVCRGKTLTCDLNNQCRTGECIGGKGCVFHNRPNGISCDDTNMCTTEDECYNGMCAVGYSKDCSHIDDPCSVGACDVTTGNCIPLARNEGLSCDDGIACTEYDVCVAGTCQGTQRSCQDNNPCTVDSCDETYGCIVQHEDYGETCIPGCLQNEDCPLEYNCFDGTCIKTQSIENQHIRMIGYEIDDCVDPLEKKLDIHFVLDTEEFTIGSEVRYRIIRSIDDITPHPQFMALGFGNSIENLAHGDFGNGFARTSFTMSTECHRFDETNCAFIFTNREFRFASKVHDCITINGGNPSDCIDPMHVIWSSVYVSLSSCTMFGGTTDVTAVRGDAVVYYKDQYYRKGLNDVQIQIDEDFGWLGIETDVYGRDGQYSIITDVRICQAYGEHYLSQCVDGTNHSACYNTGCFNWDPLDSPLSYKVDLVVGGEVTAIARSNTFLADGCYSNDNYDADDSEICTWDKCDSLGMDDNFRFKFKALGELEQTGNVYIFDVKYKHVFCDAGTEYKYAISRIQLI